jgi:hypothetical protein
MNRRSSITLIARSLLFSVVVLLGGNGMSYGQQSIDPAALVQRVVAAENGGDVAAVLALWDDAGVLLGPGLCAVDPCVGKAAIQKETERQVSVKVQLTVIGKYVSGNVAVVQVEIRNDLAQKAGVDRFIVWGIWEVKGDKIAALSTRFQRTDPQTAKFIEWQQSQPPIK